MAVEIVLVTDDTEWQTSFSRVIKEYPDLHEDQFIVVMIMWI